MNLKQTLLISASVLAVGVGISTIGVNASVKANTNHVSYTRQIKQKNVVRRQKPVVRQFNFRRITSSRVNPANEMRKQPDYRKPSELIPYPKHLSAKKDRIVVSQKKQRAYLMRGHQLRYEFYVSTGENRYGFRTPNGHYRINGVHSRWFYAPGEHEGARYAVGWHDGGLYLFHETPSNRRGRIIKSVAKDLGRKKSSHGCVHLSTSDAKWFYYHVPTGMQVIIKP